METPEMIGRIEARAKELGMSVRAISLEATGSPDTIRNWQRAARDGKEFSMRQANIDAVAAALQVSIDWLLHGDKVATAQPGMAEETRVYRAAPSESDAVLALFAKTARRAEILWRVTSDLPGLGVVHGDLIVCDLGREAHQGDTVAVTVGDSRTIIRRWFSPWLLSGDTRTDQHPLRDDENGVQIVYPVIGFIRGA